MLEAKDRDEVDAGLPDLDLCLARSEESAEVSVLGQAWLIDLVEPPGCPIDDASRLVLLIRREREPLDCLIADRDQLGIASSTQRGGDWSTGASRDNVNNVPRRCKQLTRLEAAAGLLGDDLSKTTADASSDAGRRDQCDNISSHPVCVRPRRATDEIRPSSERAANLPERHIVITPAQPKPYGASAQRADRGPRSLGSQGLHQEAGLVWRPSCHGPPAAPEPVLLRAVEQAGLNPTPDQPWARPEALPFGDRDEVSGCETGLRVYICPQNPPLSEAPILHPPSGGGG